MKKYFFTSVLFLSTLLYADTIDDINMKATRLLEEGSSAQALTFLRTYYDNDFYDDKTLLLLGLAAKENGLLNESQHYFEQLLRRNPHASRARLELASLYYETAQYEKARLFYSEIAKNNPSEELRTAIKKLIKSIDDKTKVWSAGIYIGYMQDSNVYAGPQDSSYYTQETTRSSDNAKMYGLSGTLGKPLDNTTLWRISGSMNMTDYAQLSSYDSRSSRISVELETQTNEGTLYMPLSWQELTLGGRAYSQTFAFSPRFEKTIEDITLGIEGALNTTTYGQNSLQNDKGLSALIDMRWYVQENLEVNALVNWATYKADDTLYSRNETRIFGGISYIPDSTWRFYSGVSFFQIAYDTIELGQNAVRQDTSKTLNGKITYRIAPCDCTLGVELSYEKVNSTLTGYDYSRTIGVATLTKQF